MTTLAAISLIAPAMLGGLTLLSLPIIAHLLSRRARRQVVFPTVRFLTLSSAQQSSIFRLRRWILLLLRSLAVLLIVLAFAHPIWLGPGSAIAGSNTGSAVVVIIDTSASTGRLSGGITELATLRAAAQRSLEGLRPGTDLVEVIRASATPRGLFERLSPNIPAAQADLASLTPGFGRADLAGALALAGRTLAPHTGERHILIFSDLQLSNWREIIEGPGLAAALPPGTRITIAGPPSAPTGNTALAEARIIPATPIAGHSSEARITIRNFGDAPSPVKLQLRVDGAPAGQQTVEIPPWTQAEAAFEVSLPTVGQHRIEAGIGDDALAADNRVYAVASAVDRLPVIVVGDDDPESPGSASYFLHRALAPRGQAGDAYTVTQLPTAGIAPAPLRPAAAVILAQIGPLSADHARTLLAYAQDGGAILFFCGGGPVAENLAALQAAAGEPGMLPWRPGPMRAVAASEPPFTITRGAWNDPMLRIFDGPARTALATARFSRALSTASAAPDGAVLLLFNDGSPALGLRGVGDGAVILAGFGADAASSDLAKSGAFVALIHSILDALPTRRTAAAANTVGRSLERRIAAPPTTPIRILGPDDQPLPSQSQPAESAQDIISDRTELPGFYRFNSGNQTLAWDAVNIDPRESDLRRADPEAVRAKFEGGSVSIAAPTAAINTTPDEGRPLWHVALFLAAAALAAEMALLSAWKR